MLHWSHVKCSGWKVLPRAVTTWPTIGLLQAAQTPFWVVFTPCFSIFSCKFPSISSKLVLTGSSFWSLSLNVLRDCIRSSNSWVADEALWRLEPRVHTKFEFQFGVQTKLRYWILKKRPLFFSYLLAETWQRRQTNLARIQYRDSPVSAVFWSPGNRTIGKTALIEHWFSSKIAIFDFWIFTVPQCWTEDRSSTAVAEDLRPTATAMAAEVWGHTYGRRSYL